MSTVFSPVQLTTSLSQVLLYAGPAGLKVAKIVEKAVSFGLVAPDWVQNKNSRSSQVSNGIRNTDLFVHIGEHHYAIAALPGVKEVPLAGVLLPNLLCQAYITTESSLNCFALALCLQPGA